MQTCVTVWLTVAAAIDLNRMDSWAGSSINSSCQRQAYTAQRVLVAVYKTYKHGITWVLSNIFCTLLHTLQQHPPYANGQLLRCRAVLTLPCTHMHQLWGFYCIRIDKAVQ